MTGKELYKLVENGEKIVCKTNKEIFEECLFGDAGCIVEVYLTRDSLDDDCFRVILDGSKYIDHNHSVAKPDWYDDNHCATLKYFETKHYKGNEVDDLFVDISDRWDCGLDLYFESPLKKEYYENTEGLSYVEWLEKQINDSRNPK